jgi:pantothenate kinase type III
LKPSQGFIGKNNVEAMGAGIMNGYAGALAHLINGMRQELGGEACLVRTGRAGKPSPLAGQTVALYDQWLCLDGLLRVFQAQAAK